MSEYRAAVIGLGIMGRRMVANFLRHPRFSLSGVWDPAAPVCDAAAEEFPDVAIAPSADALIAAAETDLVYIACPPQWHKEYALAAAAAGKPVFCEKPLGTDVAESEDLVRRLEAAATPNVVNFVQASCQALELTQAALASGAAGEVVGVDIVVQYRQWPRDWQVAADWLRFRDQGGYTREVISHFLFVAERLLGPARLVWTRPAYPSDAALCETHIQARLDCGGVPVAIFGSVGGVGPDRQEVTLWGSRRSHRISDFYFLEVSDGEAWTSALPPDAEPRATTLQHQLDNVAKWLDGAAHTLPSARDALSVQRLVEAMLVA
jgi:predicted dehydrogenase